MRWDVMRKFPGFWSQTLATITPGFLLFPIIIIFSSGVLCQKLWRWYIWPRSSIMQSHRIVNYKMNDSSVTSWTPLISQEITFHWNIQDFSPLPPETGYTFKPIVINLANMQVMFDNLRFKRALCNKKETKQEATVSKSKYCVALSHIAYMSAWSCT